MKKLFIENIDNYPAVVFAESAPSENFTDCSNDIEKWDWYGLQVLQYIQVRGYIFDLVKSVGNNLTPTQMKIAAKWICLHYPVRLLCVTEEEDLENFKVLYEQTSGVTKENLFGRNRIVAEIKQLITLNYFRKGLISKNDIDIFFNIVKGELEEYIATNSPKFWDWISNSVGTAYENNGFKQQTFYNENLKNEILNIMNYNY